MYRSGHRGWYWIREGVSGLPVLSLITNTFFVIDTVRFFLFVHHHHKTKTTLARGIYQRLGGENNRNVLMLSHDSYYRDQSDKPLEERSKTNFDHPDSLETELLIQHLQALKSGKSIEVPHYDFATHTRLPERVSPVVQDETHSIRIIILEGILVLHDETLTKEMDMKVFVQADADIRFIRRMTRDTQERGRTVEDCCWQYQETVRPMHDRYVEPTKHNADMIVLSNDHSLDVTLEALSNHLKVTSEMMK
jgi:uridine kinase